MNLFRIVFLFITLLCGGLLALTQLAPPVFENETNRTLTDIAQGEARTLWQSEQLAAAQRERLASSIASSSALQTALEPPLGGPPVEPARLQSVFRAVADEALLAQRTPFTVLTLVGADGTNQIPLSERGLVNMEEWISESLVSEAMESRTTLHHAFSINGRLFLSTAAPVRGASGNVSGAVLLVLEYNSAIAASRQSSVNAQIAYFAQLDIAADTIADDLLREPVRAFVRRVNEGRLGAPGSGGIPEDVRYRPADAESMGSGSDRMAVMVPISLQIGNSTRATAMDFAAVVVVDTAWPPSTLLEYIVEGQGLEAGNLTFWTFLAAALALYFIALFIHDAFLGIALDRLGAAIEANAQSNSPQSIDAKQHPSWLRSLVSRVNILIEEYRSKTSVARRAREEAEQIKEHVEAVTGTPAPLTTSRRHSDTGSVPAVGPSRRSTNTGSVPAIPLPPRPEAGAAEPASGSVHGSLAPQRFEASGALPSVMGHASTEALPAVGAGAANEGAAAFGSVTTPAQPSARPPDFDADSGNTNTAADAFLAGQGRTAKVIDDGAVYSGSEALPDQDPMEFDGLFLTGQFSMTKLAAVSAKDVTPVSDSPADSTVLSTEPAPASAYAYSAPADSSVGATTPAESTHGAQADAPAASPAPRGRTPFITDVAGQPAASTTESSGVSALINSIMVDRPSGQDAGASAAATGSWHAAQGDEASAFSVVSPAADAPSTLSSGNGVTTNPSTESPSPGAHAAPQAGSAPATEVAQSTAHHADMALPEPPTDDSRGEALSDDMLTALDAMNLKSARYEEPPAPPEPNAQTRPPVMPVPPSHTPPAAMQPEPFRTAEDAATGGQQAPPSSHTDALFSRAEEQMRKLSTTSDETFLLYGEFIAARRKCGESTADLTIEKFTQKLERSREQLRERYQTSRIDFSVDIVENRATLKARPHRD